MFNKYSTYYVYKYIRSTSLGFLLFFHLSNTLIQVTLLAHTPKKVKKCQNGSSSVNPLRPIRPSPSLKVQEAVFWDLPHYDLRNYSS